MHNHSNNNGNGGHDSKMMWMMMLACFVPIIFLTFTGGGAGRNSIWWLLGAGAVMLGLHAFAMRGHGSHGHKDDTGAVGNKPAVTPTATQADSSVQQPAVDPNTTKGENHHGNS